MSVELVPVAGACFPRFAAGAHIDLHLPNGLVRSYSLVNSQDDSDRYVIAVLNENKGGGSGYIHEQLRCGAQIAISPPRNLFPLDESATSSALIAGGIGITAILSLARRLVELGGKVHIVYIARTQTDAAFVDELRMLGGDVQWHFSDEHDGRRFDIAQWLLLQPAGTHAYCCGPNAMTEAFEMACHSASIGNVHLERFHPKTESVNERMTESQEAYAVDLHRSGRTIEVVAGDSLLDTLLNAGVDIDYSCREGICGACEVTVMAGVPLHYDSVLTPAQRESNQLMLVCVSHGRCRAGQEDRLVLDL